MADNQLGKEVQHTELSKPSLRCRVVACIEENSTTAACYPLATEWLTEVERGCSICAFIMDSIPDCKFIMENKKDPYNRFSIHKCSWNEDLFEILGPYAMTNWGEIHKRDNHIFEIFRRRDLECEMPANITPRGRGIFTDPKSGQFFTMIKGWIQDCSSGHRQKNDLSHERCLANIDVLLPKRLLDVGVHTERIFLYTPKAERGRYAALSYCWGTEGIFTTTSTTLRQREASIEYSSLPRTFQDAVTVTRKLGIQYLWIDSICILQDSKEDWKIESAKMGTYYKTAYVTISALDSRSSNDGFLHPRAPESSFPWPDPRGCHLRMAKASTQNLLEATLLQGRAWVYQERLMSTRIIHFCRTEILWECMTCERRESSAVIENDEVLTDKVLNYKESENALNRNKRLLSLLPSPLEPQGLSNLDLWYHLVNNYSQKHLTYMSDKVPATLGLVSEIRKATSCTFCSQNGVWKEDLPRGLLWKARADGAARGSKAGRIPGYPTWSWASIPGPVEYATGIAYYKSPGNTVQEPVPEFPGKSCQLEGLEIIMETKSRLVQLQKHIDAERVLRPSTFKLALQNETGRQMGEAHMDFEAGEEAYGPCLALSIGVLEIRLHGEQAFNLSMLLVRPSSTEAGKSVRVGIGQVSSSPMWGEKHHKYFDESVTEKFILQ